MHDWLAKLKLLIDTEASLRLDGTEASVNQANTCSNIISHIRRKYGFTQEIAPDPPDQRHEEREYLFTADSTMFRPHPVVWEEMLLAAVAAFFGCQPVFSDSTNLKSVRGAARQRCHSVRAYMQLYRQMIRRAAPFVRESAAGWEEFNDEPPTAADLDIWRDSFLQGTADGIDRLFAELDEIRDRISVEKNEADGTPSRRLLAAAPPEIEKEPESFRPAQDGQTGEVKAGEPPGAAADEDISAHDELILDEESYYAGLEVTTLIKMPAAFIKTRDELTRELTALLKSKRDRELRRRAAERHNRERRGEKVLLAAAGHENQLVLRF